MLAQALHFWGGHVLEFDCVEQLPPEDDASHNKHGKSERAERSEPDKTVEAVELSGAGSQMGGLRAQERHLP
jgi:hypothetical protein